MNPATRHLSAPACAPTGSATVYPILFMVSTAHLLNDMMQSVIPAVYPLLKDNFGFYTFIYFSFNICFFFF